MLLLFGWLGIVTTGWGIVWLANPLLFISWISFYRGKKKALPFSIMAAVLAASFLFFKAKNKNTIIILGAGYWLWLASCIVCFAGVLIHTIREKRLSRSLSEY
jgi:hypothetical protein